MTTLPPILNAPQVGMLARFPACPDERYSVINSRIHGTSLLPDPVGRDDVPIPVSYEDTTLQVRWPNAPEDSWVSVFAEKVEPVREWKKFSVKEDGGILESCWGPEEWASKAGDVQLCRERQSDGTWRPVTSEPTLPVDPEFSAEVDRTVAAKLADKPRRIADWRDSLERRPEGV